MNVNFGALPAEQRARRTRRPVNGRLAQLVIGCVVSILILPSGTAGGFEVVKAEIDNKEAWIGEGVRLVVTLYSPGPFSGTASFEFPSLPKTTIVKSGNPIVGSEEIDDESYFTQRHGFIVYTQQAGDIVLPAFRVRFAGRKSFTSDPEEMEGVTSELRFQSKRPPRTESMGLVISVEDLSVRQKWNPPSPPSVKAGDVVQRTLIQTASGTTAMMLPAIAVSHPPGVRTYLEQPIVEDTTERGQSGALRTDTVKYQFERPGTFTLPEMTFVWWNPKQEKIQRQTLPGLTVVVEAAEKDESAPASNEKAAIIGLATAAGLAALVCVVGVLAYLLWKTRLSIRCVVLNHPKRRAARELKMACAASDAPGAYSAALALLAALSKSAAIGDSVSILDAEEYPEARAQLERVSRHLYGGPSESAEWSGSLLWGAFRRLMRTWQARASRDGSGALPALNPRQP